MKHLSVPAFVATLSVAIIYLALDIETSPPMIVGHSLQPRLFPIFLMVINLGLAVCLAVQLRSELERPKANVSYRAWGSILLFALFYVLTVYIDILIALAVVGALMCRLWGERRLWVALAIGLLTPALIFSLFNWVLTIRFPRGLITNWFYG